CSSSCCDARERYIAKVRPCRPQFASAQSCAKLIRVLPGDLAERSVWKQRFVAVAPEYPLAFIVFLRESGCDTCGCRGLVVIALRGLLAECNDIECRQEGALACADYAGDEDQPGLGDVDACTLEGAKALELYLP